MDKQIKEVIVVFENMEGIKIPHRCFKESSFNKQDINMVIKNDYDLEYHSCYHENTKTPFQRLAEKKDITSVDLVFEDNTREEIGIDWWENEENLWEKENDNQINEFIDYRTLKISINPGNKVFKLEDILNLEGEFLGSDNKVYKVTNGCMNTYMTREIFYLDFKRK